MMMILSKLTVLLLIFLINLATATKLKWKNLQLFSMDPDIMRNSTQLIESRGFKYEIHNPITSDGYILTLIRLINPYIDEVRRPTLIPIYLQHGLFGNGDNFLLSHNERLSNENNGLLMDINTLQLMNCTAANGNNTTDRIGSSSSSGNFFGQSLAYTLSSCGYDVWLGNFRGNRYSNRHIILDSTKDPEYWSFSVDHLSEYDLIANIHYILHETGHSQLAYVGHSLGTSVMFQLLSQKPEYSKIIKPAILLAPVAYVSHIRAPLLILASYNRPFIKWLESIHMPIFGLSSRSIEIIDQLIGTFICGNSLLRPICTIFLFTLCGFDYPNLDQSLIPFAYGHFPDDTSARVLAHLAQRVKYGTFQFYDYGNDQENFKRYGTRTTTATNQSIPQYNLSSIDSEYLILISGINDWLADPDDVDIIRSQLTVKPYKDYVVPYELFNHADFLLGNNVGRLQNGLILKWLNEIYH